VKHDEDEHLEKVKHSALSCSSSYSILHVHLSYSDILIPNFAGISPSFGLLVLQYSSGGLVTGATDSGG
jgi:hypothetical protein